MTVGEMITEARLRRRKELDAQHAALMQGREPESGEAFAEWSRRVEEVREQIRAMESLQ